MTFFKHLIVNCSFHDITLVCIKDFFAEEEGDLGMKRGDLVTFINHYNSDAASEWATGLHLQDNSTGIYPRNFTVALSVLKRLAEDAEQAEYQAERMAYNTVQREGNNNSLDSRNSQGNSQSPNSSKSSPNGYSKLVEFQNQKKR